MKKNIIKILLLALLVCFAFSLVSCDLSKLPFEIPGLTNSNNNEQKEPADDPVDDPVDDPADDPVDTPTVSNDLVLIENGVANFQVVYTSASGSEGLTIANKFVSSLKKMGVSVAAPVSDRDASKVKDCEIIIGSDALNRGEECCITAKYLGVDGQAVKVVGQRIVIATGDKSKLEDRFDWYKMTQLKITATTKKLDNLKANATFKYETLTKYLVESIKIDDVDLGEFVFILDIADMYGYATENIESFRDDLYSASGYWLELGDKNKIDTYDHCFIVRYVNDAGADGFRSYIEDGNFIVECAYKNAFDTTYKTFAQSTFTKKQGDIALASSRYSYSKCVSIAYYEDFGANGSDTICDFNAIYDTHIYANDGGQKVMSRLGAEAKYLISAENFIKTIPIKTDVDFNGATFTVDDIGNTAYANRDLALFTLARDYAKVEFGDYIKDVESVDSNGNPKMITNGTIDDERFQNVTIPYETTKFDWLVGVLEAKSLVRITNTKHKDFVRHGSNQNSGNNRIDIFVVDVDGTVNENTPVAYDFDNISKIEIFRTDDKEIVVENGHFENICCRATNDTQYKCVYKAYKRGFCINRTNATIKNVTHKMIDEPDLGWSADPSYTSNGDSLYSKYGSRRESYPYYGFFYIYDTYNFHAYDSELTGHTTYYEDKPATSSTGGQVPPPVAMGSYDLIVEYSSEVYLDGVTQPCATGLADLRYWGIMSSNGSKNMFFYNCEINRFDAHRGFWNAELYNTTIGHSFQVVGGGYLIADGVTKMSKDNFISFRGDYGATFRGDITIKDCVFPALTNYNTCDGGKESDAKPRENAVVFSCGYSTTNSGYTDTSTAGAYWLWDFGYTCYMPINVTIDNFQTDAANLYLFNDLPDEIFTKSYVEGEPITDKTVKYPYQITQSVTYRNMETVIPMCANVSCTRIRSIIPIVENTTVAQKED